MPMNAHCTPAIDVSSRDARNTAISVAIKTAAVTLDHALRSDSTIPCCTTTMLASINIPVAGASTRTTAAVNAATPFCPHLPGRHQKTATEHSTAAMMGITTN